MISMTQQEQVILLTYPNGFTLKKLVLMFIIMMNFVSDVACYAIL